MRKKALTVTANDRSKVLGVDVTFAGGTYNKTTGAGVPTTVTISFNNYKHKSLFDLGKLTKVKSLSLNVDVKPSITMLYLLNANAI